MASSARNVRYLYLKMMHCKRLYHHPDLLSQRIDQTYRAFHVATKNFAAESEKEETEVEHDQHDLDFYGVHNLTDKSYEPEPLDPVKAEQFHNVKLSNFTGEQEPKTKSKTVEFEQKLPFGSIRYDKQPSKRLSFIESRLQSDDKERGQVAKRKTEKAAKKEEKKIRNLQKMSGGAVQIDNELHERDGEVKQAQNQNSAKRQTTEEVHTSKNDDTSPEPKLSYMDEMYFGSEDVKMFEREQMSFDELTNSDEINLIINNQVASPTEESIRETDLSYIDSHYFEPQQIAARSVEGESIKKNVWLTENSNDQQRENELSFIDKQYFEHDTSKEVQVTGNKLNQTPFSQVGSPTDETNEQSTKVSCKDTDLSYIDSQYFEPEQTAVRPFKSESSKKIVSLTEDTNDQQGEDELSHIDKQYFENDTSKTVQVTENKQSRTPISQVVIPADKTIKQRTKVSSEETDLSYIDKQYFEPEQVDVRSSEQKSGTKINKKTLTGSKEVLQHYTKQEQESQSTLNIVSDLADKSHTGNMYERQRSDTKGQREKEIKDKAALTNSPTDVKSNQQLMNSDLKAMQHFQDQTTQLELGNRKFKKRKATTLEEAEDDAYSVTRKLRDEYERRDNIDVYGRANPKVYDSKGFRILTGQTPDFTHVPSIDIIRVLRQNILYNNYDVVAISKPYGLPLQGGYGKDKSIDQFLGDIIPFSTLHSIDTLDTESTGVMLFGKTEEMKTTLTEKLKQGEICKRFLTITKNVPKVLQGEIDIPIVDGKVEGKHRVALRPHRTPELASVMPRQRQGKEAITRFRVLDSKENSYALMECIPITSNKHQLRAHLSLGLNCPILGDHKYSHVDKLAPMNLHPIMLERLKIQQSKVRHLALHLHCRSTVIPSFLSGRNLFVSAPLSVHFKANMRDLKLKLPGNC